LLFSTASKQAVGANQILFQYVLKLTADLTSSAELKSECSLILHTVSLILPPVFNIILFLNATLC